MKLELPEIQPQKEKYQIATFRLSREDKDAIKKMADSRGATVSCFLRQVAEWYIEAQNQSK